jgi:hypothetical protein
MLWTKIYYILIFADTLALIRFGSLKRFLRPNSISLAVSIEPSIID